MKHNMLKRLVTVALITVIICCLSLGIFADSNPIPAPDWVSITINSDGSKTLSVNTPPYMLDAVSYYEYSTDSQQTWNKLNDNTGGEFVFDTTTHFALKYVSNGFYSGIYEVTVEISKYSVITSSAGVSLLIPFNSPHPKDISLSAYEIISGTAYNYVADYFGENAKFTLLEIHIIRNHNVYENTVVNEWYFPARDMDVNYCKVYHIDASGTITTVESEPEMKVLLCTTDKTGLFAIVEDKTYSKGDVDGDAEITAGDARLALRYSAQLESLLPIQITAADADSDGDITAADARKILRAAANLEKI